MSKLRTIIREELVGLNFRLLLARLLLAPFPYDVGSRLRIRVLRFLGFRGISPNVVMRGLPRITGFGKIHKLLKVGQGSRINIGCFLNLAAEITIGDFVVIGYKVMIITGGHNIGPSEFRAGKLRPEPVKIGNGCWIGSRVTILPGVSIGDGVVVAANAVVTKDVPSNTLVAGIPAKVIRTLE